MNTQIQTVEFYSNGSIIKAHLYLPFANDANKKENYPAIVLAHGFAGVKELLLPSFAERFAQEGYVALCFDYRGFGESEGEKGKLIPSLQIEDIRNAITYVQSLTYVDGEKISLWGTSFGGANSIYTTAIDDRIKCLLVQLTFANGERVIMGNMDDAEKQKLQATLKKAWQRCVTSNKDLMLGLKQLLSDEQSKAFYDKYITDYPQLETKLSLLTLKETVEHKPEDVVKNVNVPIHIVAAENDLVNPVEESKVLFEKANEPKSLHVVKGATHYEVYEGQLFEETIKEQLHWLEKYLN